MLRPLGMGSEHEVRALMACIDADGGGTVDVAELMQFLEGEKPARRRSSGFGYANFEPDEPEREGSGVDGGAPPQPPARPARVDWAGGLRGEYVAPEKKQEPLAPDEAEALRAKLQSKLKAASYTANGPDVEAMFRRFDKDGSGELDEQELRKVLRLTALGRLSL